MNAAKEDNHRRACQEILSYLLEKKRSHKELGEIKITLSKKYRLNRIIGNVDILSLASPKDRRKLIPLLKRKPVRTMSGVAVISVMTKPYPCPQDEPCAYCPGGTRFDTPQSYTGHEPAALRGIQNNFDPFRQVSSRLSQLREMGHDVTKAELILMGGTFLNFPPSYQRVFVKRCLDALNGLESPSLSAAKKVAETASVRNVGLTVETRPDFCKIPHVDRMLSYGVTRVEIGVQTLHQDILNLVGRKHSINDVVEAFQIAKDSGLKIVAHMMPGLPGSSSERDLESLHTLFEDPRFKPDMMKIYPCLVVKGTKVYDWWRERRYEPLSTERAAELIAEVKKFVPPWLRIMRIQRDIPTKLIEAGVKNSNLRQIVKERALKNGYRCRCIRCREVGQRMLADKVKPNTRDVELCRIDYEASDGTEIFLSMEDKTNDVLIGYLRLRIPSERAHRREVRLRPSAIVRELHVYGEVVPLGKRYEDAWQHRGLGDILLSQAEKISRQEYDRKKLVVISALGTKEYYKKFGYAEDGPYVSKALS